MQNHLQLCIVAKYSETYHYEFLIMENFPVAWLILKGLANLRVTKNVVLEKYMSPNQCLYLKSAKRSGVGQNFNF